MCESEPKDEPQGLDGWLNIRVNTNDLSTFISKAPNTSGTPYQILLREIITAFNDDRLKITPTESQKKTLKLIGTLYDVN